MYRALTILIVIAASSVLLTLVALTQGVDKAIILLPAFLAITVMVEQEMLEDAEAEEAL